MKIQYVPLFASALIATLLLSASATEIVVTTTLDELEDPGTGLSLREAIRDAPNDPTTQIIFDPEVFVSPNTTAIILTNGPLIINKSISINASNIANGVKIDADQGGHRVISISQGEHNVTLVGLTITGGDAQNQSGGGLYNLSSSPVTVKASIISNNSAGNSGGGIYNSLGDLILKETTISDNTARNNGGGVFNLEGDLNISKSLVSDNSSFNGSGGGITNSNGNISLFESTLSGNSAHTNGGGLVNLVFGTVTFDACTIIENQSRLDGGAISNFRSGLLSFYRSTLQGNLTQREGGGIANLNNGTVKITSSTIVGNAARFSGGGIINTRDGICEIDGSTFAGNTAGSFGAGLAFYGGSLMLTNSVIADNETESGSSPDIELAGEAMITTSGHNFIGINQSVEDEFPEGFLVGSTNHPHDPLLAPLAIYGGLTKTKPPLPGSPLIESGLDLPNRIPTIDQIGHPRILGRLPDLGAVEALPFSDLNLSSEDGDRIPDLLEGPDGPYPQLDPLCDDSEIDTDGDGFADEEEIANMTNPLDPADFLRIIALVESDRLAPGDFSFDLKLRTFPSLTYSLETSTTLSNFEILPNSTFVGEGLETTRTLVFDHTQIFIRVRRGE